MLSPNADWLAQAPLHTGAGSSLGPLPILFLVLLQHLTGGSAAQKQQVTEQAEQQICKPQGLLSLEAPFPPPRLTGQGLPVCPQVGWQRQHAIQSSTLAWITAALHAASSSCCAMLQFSCSCCNRTHVLSVLRSMAPARSLGAGGCVHELSAVQPDLFL